MANSISSSAQKSKSLADLAFMLLGGLLLGIMGGLLGKGWASVASAAVLFSVFGLYNALLKRNEGILSGLIAGSIMGVAVGTFGFLAGGTIDGPLTGAHFGFIRGATVGAIAGIIIRAQPHQRDGFLTRLFLAVGSVVVGALLAAGVGLAAGAILGIVGSDSWAMVKAALLGVVVGGYLISYDQIPRRVVAGSLAGASLAMAGVLAGGAIAGVILGAFSGALAPMLLVSLIGAYGGLSSRGPRAMVIEALEAPSEMVMQGAVPFLAPAMMVGIIVGTTAAGAGGLIALTVSLAFAGLLLGALGELEGRYNCRVTVRSIIEMIVLGADQWPLNLLSEQVSGQRRRAAVAGVALGAAAGTAGSIAGVLMGQMFMVMVQSMI